MDEQQSTVAEVLRSQFNTLTRAERQLADVLLAHYPVAGLSSITGLAKKAQVSTPTVARLVKKIGFSGYPDFQASLRSELEATISSPIAKHDQWAEGAPDTHILNRFAEASMTNLQRTLSRLDTDRFDAVAGLLADPERGIYLAGGRITHSLAEYLFTHLQVIRGGVTLATSHAGSWPHILLNMQEGDVLIVFDVRRYENNLVRFAELASERGVIVVLFTDQWGSPTAKHARHVFSCRIEAPSAWDSSVVMMMISEALIAAVENLRWEATRERMNDLETLFDQTRLLRKFV
ncbi:MurR/RpiR family transcriptional regulator [Ferruginivarius sediminum]|uniref:MurR/RpiR family transcriptional regulator n=1 Tax=Ferruginivarius sediminum TaxID=2661937 RepID=A0A369TBN7_9PROT|nr:MurR/RpiR family transcriptional regulator [Ferruginivarius sediminum]RDD61934.1 MurR/RpiR family transcriptional regulator [Ferruginivarius sediminum]